MPDWLNPILLGQFLIGGLLAGALYALLASGLNLIFGVMRVINLAHAELMLMGAFLAYVFYAELGWNPLLALPLIMATVFLFGYYLERLLIERVIGKGQLPSLLLTYAISIILTNIGVFLFSSNFKSVPVMQGAILLGDFVVPKPRGVAAIVAVVVTLGVYLFLDRTRMGKAVRAVSEHAEVATICGIDVVRVRMLTFGLAAAMAAAAGVMLSIIYSFSPETGPDFLSKAFAIIIIGGMGNFAGALYGGVLLGVIEAFVGGFASSQWAETVAYLLLVLVLLIRPTGLKGTADVR